MNTSRNKDRWDSLSMKEKSDMMKVAVQQGIYNLSDIRKTYNEYAEGGPENQPYTPFLNETPMQAAIKQIQSPEARAAYWNATHPQTTNETPIVAQPDYTFRRETRNIPLNTAGEAAKTALEFTPVVGDVLYAGDVADEARQGNYGTAAALAGLAVLPNVVEKPLKKGLRKIGLFDNATTAARATPAEWTAAQDAAIARGAMAEAQRLRDLHFKVNTPGNVVTKEGMPIHNYHGTKTNFNEFDLKYFGQHDPGDRGYGFYFSQNRDVASDYGNVINDYYLNATTPYTGKDWYSKYINRGNKEDIVKQIHDKIDKEDARKIELLKEKYPELDTKSVRDAVSKNSSVERENIIGNLGNIENTDVYLSPYENVVYKPNQIKSANAVTYDDKGVRIPLGERDNFSINDIRYVWPTALLGGTAAASYANQQGLGGPLVQLANRYEEGGPTEEDRVLDLSDRGYKSKEDLKITGIPPLVGIGPRVAKIAEKATDLNNEALYTLYNTTENLGKWIVGKMPDKYKTVIGELYNAFKQNAVGTRPKEGSDFGARLPAFMQRVVDSVNDEKAYGGPLISIANKYDGYSQPTQQIHRPYILTESETTPIAGYNPWGITVAADTSNLNEDELGLTLPEINVGLENYNINEKINEAQNKAGEIGATVLGTAPIAAGALSAPLATLTGLAGGYAGDYLGGKAGSYFGEKGELLGRVLGGLAGGMAGGFVSGKYLDPAFNKYLERVNINSKQSLGNSTNKTFVDANLDNAAYSISSDSYNNAQSTNNNYFNDKFKQELFKKYAEDTQRTDPTIYKQNLNKQIQQDVQSTINRGDPVNAFYKALDMDKRFKFIPSSKFVNYDIYNMSIGEVERMFGPEGVTLKNMLDIAKAHNFEGKYGELAKKWEAELENLFPISKEDPDIALGIERTKNLYSIPEYRQRFNKVAGTLGDTFVEDALDRLANVKLQGVHEMPIGKHGLKPSGSAHPNSLDPRHSLIKIQNTDSSTGLQNVVQHETGHITHGTEVLEPAWMKRHNESIKPKLKPRFQNSDESTIKYQNRLDEIIARSKTAVEYADRIRKPGESLEDALDRVYELGKNTQSGASGDIKDLVWYFDKESLLNFWKKFVGGYVAPVAVGTTIAATTASQ